MKPLGEPGVLAASDLYLSFPSEFARKNLFFIDRCGHYVLDRHYLISRSAPAEIRFLILYVTKGSLSLVVGSRDYTIHENEIAIVDTRSTISMLPTETHRCTGSALTALLGDTGRRNLPLQPCIHSGCHVPHSGTCPGNCLVLCRRDDHERGNDFRLYPSDSVCPHRPGKNHHPCGRYGRIREHPLYSDPLSGISDSDTAGRPGLLKPGILFHKFKKETGSSPKEYILNIRINAAKILLSNTGMTIRQVAACTGFQNEAYFSSYFKKKTGAAPSEWRTYHE